VSGDFVAQTRVVADTRKTAFSGLLLWRDGQNFVRLELRDRRREMNGLHMEGYLSGAYLLAGRGRCGGEAPWLRIERVGDEVRGLCSVDLESWHQVGTIRFPSDTVARVGIFAIWSGPDSTAWFDQFLLWRGDDP
jgi:regulation of enolase protein 1 (concanavalin A-like superfamily)